MIYTGEQEIHGIKSLDRQSRLESRLEFRELGT